MPTMDFETYLPTNASETQQSAVLTAILENEDAAGIEIAVVMPIPEPRPDNRALAEAIRNQPRLIGCCQVNPSFGEESIQEFEMAVTQWGMRMLKLMPSAYNCSLFSPQAAALMDKARELGVVVNIHSGGNHSHPLQIGALCQRYPDVPVIMDHMGYRQWLEDALIAAKDNPNLYLGTTIASFEPSRIERAVKEVGPERVIFGSNLVSLYADLAAEAIRRRKLGSEVETLIFGGNLARILDMG